MEVRKSDTLGGSLQISTDVICKIAKLAAMEIDGIKDVSCGASALKGAFAKVSTQKSVTVELRDEVAEININVIVAYGSKIPAVCEAVQKNIKSSVQNMTAIIVSKVNVVAVGVAVMPTDDKTDN